MKKELSIFLVGLFLLVWMTSFSGVVPTQVNMPEKNLSTVELIFTDGSGGSYCDAVNNGVIAPSSGVAFARRLPNNFPLYSQLNLDRDFYIAPDFAHRSCINIGRVEFAYTPQSDYYIYTLHRIRI